MFTRQLLEEFLRSRSSGISAKTIQLYHYALDKFIGYPLSPEGINSYLNSLSCGNGKTNYFRCIKALCRWLCQNDYIESNPAERVSAPRRQKKLLSAITQEQLGILLQHCEDGDKAIISLLWHSGLRLSEVANVRASDFNWKEGTVIVLGKGNKYRKAVAGNSVVKTWFEQHDSFERNAKGIKCMLWRLSNETGIHCNAHSFRRGFCVHQVKSGLSTRVVQALGGWETIAMVERYSKSLTFDDALQLYKQVNGGEI
jgi:site-specific recombinase XerC